MTNREYINQMSDEELSKLLYDRANGKEYSCGDCPNYDNCTNDYGDFIGEDNEDKFCINQIAKWLKSEYKGGK